MGLLDEILDIIFDDDWKGRRGEKLTERELNLVEFFGRDGKVLRNVYIPSDKGTSEIDVLFITVKGIFVIESKNYSGWIFGDADGQKWTMMLPNKEKHQFYNPMKQNATHIKWLKAYLGDIPMHSMIVFSERCSLKKVPAGVIKRDDVYRTVRRIWDSTDDVLTNEQVNEIVAKLQERTNVSKEVKQAHVSDIRNNCPYCGGNLVERTAKKGPNAGNKFLGCENFPKCRYVRNIYK